MINERVIAEKFSAIWKQHLPLLTPNFMRVFNEAKVIPINSTQVMVNSDVRYDLVSEAAFILSELVFSIGKSATTFLSNKSKIQALEMELAKAKWLDGNYSPQDLHLNKEEIDETIKITNNILEFIMLNDSAQVLFRPNFRGYGFIPDITGDISFDDTLYEIKTVNRNFKSNDLKQLFIYLALEQAGPTKKHQYAGLYNPRRGTFCRFHVQNLISGLTGGKTPNEAFNGLLDSLVRDIQIDSKF